MTLTPLQSWLLVIASFVALWLLYRALDGWLGRKVEKSLGKNAAPWRWGGEPGTRAPKGHVSCRDCGYFYPRDAVNREGVCDDCRGHDEDLQSMLDYAYEHDAIFIVEPCRHSTVEWIAHDGSDLVSLICSECRVALVTETVTEWLAEDVEETEDHR